MKVCKGTGKAVGYGCGMEVPIMRYGLCKKCFAEWVLNTEEGKKMLNRAQLRAKKEKRKKDLKWRRDTERAIETKSDLEKKLQRIVNGIVRELDKDKGCISCDHGWGGKFTRQRHAGHRLSVGSSNNIRFNLHNIYGQCSICNNWKSSNERMYDEGLIKHYGEDVYNMVKSLRAEHRDVHWDKEDLRGAIERAANILKELKAGVSYTRDDINKVIGLYK